MTHKIIFSKEEFAFIKDRMKVVQFEMSDDSDFLYAHVEIPEDCLHQLWHEALCFANDRRLKILQWKQSSK